MSESKVSSKFIGRDPLRSFKSLYSFKAKVLRYIGEEYLNTDSDEEQ